MVKWKWVNIQKALLAKECRFFAFRAAKRGSFDVFYESFFANGEHYCVISKWVQIHSRAMPERDQEFRKQVHCNKIHLAKKTIL